MINKTMEILRFERMTLTPYLREYLKDKKYFEYKHKYNYQCTLLESGYWNIFYKNNRGKIVSEKVTIDQLMKYMVIKSSDSSFDLILDQKYIIYPKY
jgi:hypothetical protein